MKQISKTVNGVKTEYHYAGDKLTEVVKGSDIIYIDYDVLGPCAVEYNGVRYYCTRNAQGNIDVITDASGTNVTVYRYDAWGNTFSKTGTMSSTLGSLNPLRYRGYVYDEETGLYYLGTRYYSPKLGRFINADGYVSTGQGLLGSNMYAYCNNDPVDHLDSDGELASWLIGAVVGAIIGGISAAVSGCDFKETIACIAQGAFSGAYAGAAVDIAVASMGIGLIGYGGAMVISGVGGFAGSIGGDAVYSAISQKNMNLKASTIKGAYAGFTNTVSFGISKFVDSVFGTEKFYKIFEGDLPNIAAAVEFAIVSTTINTAVDITSRTYVKTAPVPKPFKNYRGIRYYDR